MANNFGKFKVDHHTVTVTKKAENNINFSWLPLYRKRSQRSPHSAGELYDGDHLRRLVVTKTTNDFIWAKRAGETADFHPWLERRVLDAIEETARSNDIPRPQPSFNQMNGQASPQRTSNIKGPGRSFRYFDINNPGFFDRPIGIMSEERSLQKQALLNDIIAGCQAETRAERTRQIGIAANIEIEYYEEAQEKQQIDRELESSLARRAAAWLSKTAPADHYDEVVPPAKKSKVESESSRSDEDGDDQDDNDDDQDDDDDDNVGDDDDGNVGDDDDNDDNHNNDDDDGGDDLSVTIVADDEPYSSNEKTDRDLIKAIAIENDAANLMDDMLDTLDII